MPTLELEHLPGHSDSVTLLCDKTASMPGQDLLKIAEKRRRQILSWIAVCTVEKSIPSPCCLEQAGAGTDRFKGVFPPTSTSMPGHGLRVAIPILLMRAEPSLIANIFAEDSYKSLSCCVKCRPRP